MENAAFCNLRSIHGGDISFGTAATVSVFVTNKAKSPIAISI